MKHSMKRWFSLFLTLVMLLSLFPTAFAAEAEPEEEIAAQEDGIVEEIPEEPAEPETPEECEDWEVTDAAAEPEEPEVPEEPETPDEAEVPEEEPEAAEEEAPAEEAEDALKGFDGNRIMSEPVGKRKMDVRETVTVTVSLTGADSIAAVAENNTGYLYLVAQNKTDRYYLAVGEYDSGSYEYSAEGVLLPAGEYQLFVAALNGDGSLVAQAANKTLLVLAAPVVTMTKADAGDGKGELTVNLANADPNISAVECDEPGDTIDIEEFATAGGVISGLKSGDYRFRYLGGETGEVIALASDWTKVSVMEDLPANAILASFEGSGSNHETTLYYKGAKDKIIAMVAFIDPNVGTPREVADNRVTFKSSDKKVAAVDAAGNVTAVAAGEAVITVTSTANPGLFAELTVKVEPLAAKSLKFDEAKYSSDEIYEDFFPAPVILVEHDRIPEGVTVPMTVTVSGGKGMRVYDPARGGSEIPDEEPEHYASSVSLPITGETTEVYVHPWAIGGGHFTVTAEFLGKTATCTVDVDGFAFIEGIGLSTAQEFYKDGKAVTGWMSLGGDGDDTVVTLGKAALKNIGTAIIYYFDPATKQAVLDGVRSIDKKLYLFANGALVTGGNADYCFAQEGHLLTGWQNGFYYAPATGRKTVSAWVPAVKGKGQTWVNEDGVNAATNPMSGAVTALDGDIAFAEINGQMYFFAKGVRKSGWVYLSMSGSSPITTKAKADFMIYCDPKQGDAVRTQAFFLKGKEYRPVEFIPGRLPLPKITGVKGAKYLYLGNSGGNWIAASDGSVAKNVFADVWVNPSEHHYMYAKADGSISMNEWVAVKGKSLYFGSNGFLAETVSDTGLAVQTRNGQYTVYAKLNTKKPADGYSYYVPEFNGGKKLTNTVLMDSNSGNFRLVLDKKGKAVSNAVVKTLIAVDDPASTVTLAVGTDGKVLIPTGLYSNYYGVVTVKGKQYAVNNSGVVRTEPGLVDAMVQVLKQNPWGGGYYSNDYGVVNVGKNGVLSRNALVKTKINGQTYKVWFGPDGLSKANATMISSSGNSLLYVKGKIYAVQQVDDLDVWAVMQPAKAGWYPVSSGESCYVNKDGSIKTGWVTAPDGSRQYYMLQVIPSSYGSSSAAQLSKLSAKFNYNTDLALFRFGKKLYLFDDSGTMRFGWVHVKQATIIDMSSKGGTAPAGTIEDSLLYFDPKTGAAAAGGWKKVPAPMATESGISYGKEDLNIAVWTSSYPGSDPGTVTEPCISPVNISSKTAKLYFNADGSLVRGTTKVIGKKLYQFAPDGTSSLTAGWLDAGRTQYMLKNGALAKGRQKIDNVFYFFDGEGVKQTNALRRSGKAWYYYGAGGAQETPAADAGFVGLTAALTPVWNKNGSLAKVVYVNSGRPAAGETVCFGPCGEDITEDSLYVLDGKGLPVTGLVTGTGYDGDPFTMLLNDDGSRVRNAGDGVSLIAAGNKIYAMADGLILVGEEVVEATDWSGLPAADRQALDTCLMMYRMRAQSEYGGEGEVPDGLPVYLNTDGSVAANEFVPGEAYHTNRFGVPMEMTTLFFYRFDGKWFGVSPEMDGAILPLSGPDEMAMGRFRVSPDGELIGVFNAQTGDALNGTFVPAIPLGPGGMSFQIIFVLKNGIPQTGKYKVMGYSFEIDPDIGIYIMT